MFKESVSQSIFQCLRPNIWYQNDIDFHQLIRKRYIHGHIQRMWTYYVQTFPHVSYETMLTGRLCGEDARRVASQHRWRVIYNYKEQTTRSNHILHEPIASKVSWQRHFEHDIYSISGRISQCISNKRAIILRSLKNYWSDRPQIWSEYRLQTGE